MHFEKGNTKTNNNTFKTFPVSGYLFLGKLLLTQSYHFNRFDRLNFFLTGGWASPSCPHMVVYCIKFVLRGESPRDYVDMLRSLAFPPSINISDMPHRIATHANNTVPHFFRPNDGRLFQPTEENIDAAKEGRLVIHLPWVQGSSIPKAFQFSFGEEKSQEEVHPVTGVTDRYSLCDRFHEKNSSSAPDILRRVTLVPELNAVINTEVEEQLHSSINRSNYTFNMMLPGNHLFMMRLKIHLSNTHIDQVYRCKLEKAICSYIGTAKGLQHDTNGILLLQTTQSIERGNQEEEEGNANEGQEPTSMGDTESPQRQHDTDKETSFANPVKQGDSPKVKFPLLFFTLADRLFTVN